MSTDQRRKAWAVRSACTIAAALLCTVSAGTAAASSGSAGSPIPGLPALPAILGLPGLAQPPNFAPPQINPGNGESVGVAQPVIVTFKAPVADHARAESNIHITSSPVVTGHFYWFGDKQVRWRPDQFWPANTDVTVQAGGSTSKYRIGDAFVATADDHTHLITVTRNGQVVRVMKTSMGEPGHDTPNGTYIVGDKHASMIMDSATYGVPSTAPGGYRLEVHYATRIANNGIFVHAAPWSVAEQGYSDVSHGCLNVSDADAEWYFDNVEKGDAVIVANTHGGTLDGHDGLGDWNLP
jgi:lipoprotein-anchoring transpeptidase ErfK/SrfK